MLLGGISGVILGYSRLDGGAARARVGKVSLFSDFRRGRPTACIRELYKACSLCIICINIRSVCVDRTCLSLCHIILSNYIPEKRKFFPKKLKLRIDLKWPEMRSKAKVNFGHPK